VDRRKRDCQLYKRRAYASGSRNRKEPKEAKMREEDVAAESRNIEVTILQRQ